MSLIYTNSLVAAVAMKVNVWVAKYLLLIFELQQQNLCLKIDAFI